VVFSIFEDVIESGCNIVDDFFEGEAPSKRDVAKVGSAAIGAYGVSEGLDLLSDLLDD